MNNLMMNFLSNIFNIDEKEYRIIPYNWCATEFYIISFEGWNALLLDVNDNTLNKIIIIASESLSSFLKLYKDDCAFSQPIFSINSDGTCKLKISIMKNEIYDELKKIKQT